MQRQLTDALARSVKPPTSGRLEITDTRCVGLVFRVTPNGIKSWSFRFRDRNSLLTQAEWRIVVNRYLDLAFFYDAAKVTARTSDLDLQGLKSDYGAGLRFHGPFATPLRVEIARSPEGLGFVFSSSAGF